ncbi:hypothetical protein HMPREF1203_01532 [Bacteroides fragilis HMW 610]|nr:hypothetical protein HMPREF1203_01532 [Bacteroides fragilis HMW 610]
MKRDATKKNLTLSSGNDLKTVRLHSLALLPLFLFPSFSV